MPQKQFHRKEGDDGGYHSLRFRILCDFFASPFSVRCCLIILPASLLHIFFDLFNCTVSTQYTVSPMILQAGSARPIKMV